SRNGIFGAVYPRIVVVPTNNPRVGVGGPRNLEDYVVDRLDIPVRRHAHMNLRGTGTDVIGQRQCASPLLWRHWSAQRLQQKLSVAIGDRENWNLCDRLCVFAAQALC